MYNTTLAGDSFCTFIRAWGAFCTILLPQPGLFVHISAPEAHFVQSFPRIRFLLYISPLPSRIMYNTSLAADSFCTFPRSRAELCTILHLQSITFVHFPAPEPNYVQSLLAPTTLRHKNCPYTAIHAIYGQTHIRIFYFLFSIFPMPLKKCPLSTSRIPSNMYGPTMPAALVRRAKNGISLTAASII